MPFMIPGDLVSDGRVYAQWASQFFDPAKGLLAEVPVYPVPGNHEQDAQAFFDYFHLPDNGSAGFEEHWWWHDVGNVRMIGLDSNGLYGNQTQLEWLQGTLDATCEDETIDFVFAQLHHPHQSELWTPGNVPFTGRVIEALEAFSSDCGKPSIHFFGHTHGYSRGASQDHQHLMVNVASGASWVSFHHGGGVGIGFAQHAGQVIVADGTDEAAARLQRVLTNDPLMGIFRHADAGYDEARRCAAEHDVHLPME